MRSVIETGDFKVSFEDTPEVHREVYLKVLHFFKDQEAFSGEAVMQNDGPQINGPELLAELADDIYKFDVEYIED